ncbi:MAG: sterol desaturase family protein [Salinisphaeraceae bacterium]|nr:sterol desaturase family protein [Salinisphaeraceae bacterium]
MNNQQPSTLASADSPATAGQALQVFFTHPSPLILLGLTLGFTSLRIYLGNWSWADVIAPLVIFAFWPMLEWLIHVFMLHYKPVTLFGKKIDFLLPQTHREHHAEPWKLKRVFIPLHVFPLVAPALIIACYLILPTVEIATGALAVYFLLALNYEFCHYLAHVRWSPPSAYYRRRVRLHRYHHFKNENKWWGVSMGLGDILLGTAPKPEETERSETTGNLLGS